MTKEQIKQNMKKQLLNNHKYILKDICMNVNNCIDCLDEVTRELYCCPCVCMKAFYLTKESFCIESYDDQELNRDLINLADSYGYNAGLICKDDCCMIKYWKV